MQHSTDEQARLRQRILERVDVIDLGHTTPCWISNRAKHSKGYTKIGYRGSTLLTHRLAYEVFRHPIPDELVIDHLCRNRACANPDHLEIVTTRENLLRGQGLTGQQARRTHCLRGHPLYGPNLYRSPGRPATRECRTCRAAASERLRGRLKA